MQIYVKDGKALKVKSEVGVLTPKSSGETWVLNVQGNAPQNALNGISFLSNGVQFSSIYVYSDRFFNNLNYDSTNVCALTSTATGFEFDGWVEDAYRTLIFTTPPTGDLLTWLQANGVKQ